VCVIGGLYVVWSCLEIGNWKLEIGEMREGINMWPSWDVNCVEI